MKRIVRDKKKASALILGLSFIAAGASFAIPSLAWLAKAQTTAKLDGLEGEAHGSYFNGGDGSADHPFEIDNARQLYYFNWLQDLGYFNAPNDDKSGIDQTYFILTSDIDASGYVLPPAGTKEYPFVGSFDGNGKTISNVTITNNYADLRNPPVGAEEDSTGILSQAEIVGFFGVVGSTTSESEVNGYSYDSSALEIRNLGLSGAAIESASSNTLVGLAAGYVNGTLSGVGVDSSSIATRESARAITDISGVESISEYSLVGYATEEYRSSTQVSDETMSMPQITNPNTDHGSTNWGGSVDMEQMYNDLQSERDDSSISSDVYYVSSETVDVDPDGNEGDPYNIQYSSNRAGRGDYYFKNGERKDSDGNVIASYGLTYQSTSDDYIYIYGKPSTTPTSSDAKRTVNRNIYSYATAIGKNGNYLCVSVDGALTNSTDLSTASGWAMPDDIESGYLSTTVNKTTYYLNLSGTSALSISKTASTVWTYDAANGSVYCSDNSNAYYLDYSTTSGWTVSTYSIDGYYLVIKDASSNVYVGYDSSKSSLQASNTPSKSNYAWNYSNNGYQPLDSSVYLSASASWSSSASVVLTSSTSNWFTSYGRFNLDGAASDGTGTGKMKASLSGRRAGDYYLYYGGSSFSATTTSSNGHTFVVSKVIEGGKKIGLSFSDATEADKIVKKEMVERDTSYYMNQTYIPLAYSYDDSNNINGVSQMNTGYLVGGANYVNGTDYAGDIRIAEAYTLSQLYTSFNQSSSSWGGGSSGTYSSANAQVLTRSTKKNTDGTYTDNGWTRIKDSYNSSNINSYSSSLRSSFSTYVDSSIFSRYDNARRNLQYTIFDSYDNASKNSSTSLYGLHFMNAAISTDHLAKVGKAVVYDEAAEAKYHEALKKYLNKETDVMPSQEGSEYYNYEVPEDSIDFNLATEGFINFFGATYYVNNSYGTNNSFFSLNKIERDSNQKITSIKEIKQIYANTGDDKDETPYVYSYDGSVPSNSDSNHLVFDVTWISTNSTIVTYCLYYFEIPVNPGEYALGSVSGKQGSYLLYLDIGTAAADYDSVTIEEKTTSKIIKQSYPKGVDFTSSFANLPSLTGGNSACVAILVAPAKKIDYDYEGATLTVGGPVSSLETVFKNDGITVSGKEGTIAQTSDSPLIITMERTTIQTFTSSNNTLSLAYQATWTITGASSGDEIQLYFLSDSATWKTTTSSLCNVSTSGLVTVTGSGSLSITAEGAGTEAASSDWEGPTPITKEETFGELKLSITGGSASVEYVYDEDNKTYKVTVHSDVDVSVKVISVPSDSDYKIVVNGTEVTAKDQTFTVEANSSSSN